jgi:hypothetical protein
MSHKPMSLYPHSIKYMTCFFPNGNNITMNKVLVYHACACGLGRDTGGHGMARSKREKLVFAWFELWFPFL